MPRTKVSKFVKATTLNIMSIFATLSITILSIECSYAECDYFYPYAEFCGAGLVRNVSVIKVKDVVKKSVWHRIFLYCKISLFSDII
jgi:hypothetical protein